MINEIYMGSPIERRGFSPEFFTKYQNQKVEEDTSAGRVQDVKKGHEGKQESGDEARKGKREQAMRQQRKGGAFDGIPKRDMQQMIADSDSYDPEFLRKKKEQQDTLRSGVDAAPLNTDEIVFSSTVAGMSGQFGEYRMGSSNKSKQEKIVRSENIEEKEGDFTVEGVLLDAQSYYDTIAEHILSGDIKRDIRGYEDLKDAISTTQNDLSNAAALKRLGSKLFRLSIQRGVRELLPENIKQKADFLKEAK